jgi:hypothetical protein
MDTSETGPGSQYPVVQLFHRLLPFSSSDIVIPQNKYLYVDESHKTISKLAKPIGAPSDKEGTLKMKLVT